MNGMCSYSIWWLLIQRDWYYYQGDLAYLKEQKDYLTGLLRLLISKVGDDGVELLQKCVPVIQLLGVHGASSSDVFLLSCHIPPGFARFPLPVGGKCGIIPLVMRPWRNWYTRWISVMSPQ